MVVPEVDDVLVAAEAAGEVEERVDGIGPCGAAFGEWTLWQFVQETFRRSWALPSHPAWLPRLWQERHVSLTSAGLICLNFRI